MAMRETIDDAIEAKPDLKKKIMEYQENPTTKGAMKNPIRAVQDPKERIRFVVETSTRTVANIKLTKEKTVDAVVKNNLEKEAMQKVTAV